MNIRVPEELILLAKIFKKNKETLYIVGGYIRNQILGIPDSYNIDIDICSSAVPEKVVKILKDTDFKVNYMNKDLGVLEIKRNLRVEYATFRKEKYAISGIHLPNNIEFIKDLKIDAERRDFRCNAVYYDILKEEVVDPFNGVTDIEKRIIRTTKEPNEVFADDAERILRMVRFASTLGFNIDQNTYYEAKNNVYKLQYISSTRKREEFSKIVLADTKYPFLFDIKYAHARGVMILADLGALGYILPALEAIRLSNIIEDKGKYLFNHVINVFAISKPQIRLSALLHDVGKAKTFIDNRNFNGSQEFAEIIIEKNLGQEGLCFSKKIVERVKNVVLMQDFNKLGLETAKNIKKFIFENYENIELILELKNAIALDKSNKKRKSFSSLLIKRQYDKMILNNTPFKLSDLNIRGDKIITLYPKIKLNQIGILLNLLLEKCIQKPYLNTERNLVYIINKLIKRKPKKYLED